MLNWKNSNWMINHLQRQRLSVSLNLVIFHCTFCCWRRSRPVGARNVERHSGTKKSVNQRYTNTGSNAITAMSRRILIAVWASGLEFVPSLITSGRVKKGSWLIKEEILSRKNASTTRSRKILIADWTSDIELVQTSRTSGWPAELFRLRKEGIPSRKINWNLECSLIPC